MQTELVMRDLFRLPNGTTVLACESTNGAKILPGSAAKITNGNEVRQSIILTGERQMLNQSLPQSQKAVETGDKVDLSAAEVKSGLWRLLVDD